MRIRDIGLGSLAALILVLGGGCKKSGPEGERRPTPVTNAPPATIARVHWVGKKHITTGKSTNYLASVWRLPPTERLEAQTLDKLALALTGEPPLVTSNRPAAAGSHAASTNPPAPLLVTNQPAVSQLSMTNHPLSTKLRPLLDDLVRHEWYLEVQQAPNQPAEVALAVQLDDQRAELWTSNLTAVLGTMTNAQTLPAAASRCAWRLQIAPRPSSLAPPLSRLDLARAGDWTLLGMAAETNGLLTELIHRVRTEHTPVSASSLQMDPITRRVRPGGPAATNDWLEADVDLRRVSSALSLGWQLPEAWPRIDATWANAGEFVRTSARLTFAQPLNLQLEPWNIPTNFIREPLVSFSAVRGVRSWLAGLSWLQKLHVEPVPNQFCAWASTAAPTPTFAAVPMTNAAAFLQAIGPRIEAEYNPWVTNHAYGEIEFSKEPPNLNWSGIPMFTPELEAITTPTGDFLLGRLGPRPPENSKPAPPELFAQLTARSNLVYYDWEITQVKVSHWLYLGQTARLALLLPQMQHDSAAFALLLEVGPRLGNSGTEVLQDGPASLSFVRNSHLGFTSVELHLLADWLESPAFPRGLHSLLAPRPEKWPHAKPITNSIPHMPLGPRRSTNPPAPPR